MNSWFYENQTEFTVLVFTVAFQMLADGDGFLDQIVKILRNIWFQTQRFHDAKDFVTANKAHLSNTMGISQNDTYELL